MTGCGARPGALGGAGERWGGRGASHPAPTGESRALTLPSALGGPPPLEGRPQGGRRRSPWKSK